MIFSCKCQGENRIVPAHETVRVSGIIPEALEAQGQSPTVRSAIASGRTGRPGDAAGGIRPHRLGKVLPTSDILSSALIGPAGKRLRHKPDLSPKARTPLYIPPERSSTASRQLLFFQIFSLNRDIALDVWKLRIQQWNFPQCFCIDHSCHNSFQQECVALPRLNKRDQFATDIC